MATSRGSELTGIFFEVEPTSDRLHASLADPSKADEIAAAVEVQREHFDLFGLQFGYVYVEGALVPEEPPAEQRPEQQSSPSDYEPTARPGARMPHPWLGEIGGASTLDLVPVDRPVLISFCDHEAWASALGAADVSAVPVGVETPRLDSWRKVCGVDDTGALLVRPDHHVAWRARSAAQLPELSRALAVIAGRSIARRPNWDERENHERTDADVPIPRGEQGAAR